VSTDVQTPSPVRPVAELREVQGPTALGGGSRRFFDLLKLISVTEFKRVYFGTVLGYVWSLLRPLLLFGVLLLVFTQVFRVGSEKVESGNYPVFLLMGIILYTFFSEATGNAVTSVVSQEGVVRKTQFPRAVIPLATVVTSFFNLMLNLVILLVFLLAFGVSPAWTWFLFPVVLAFLFVGTAGMAMALSALYVRFRDTAIIWVVASQALLYLTPILYPVNSFGEETKEHLLMINPLSVIFEQARVWVLHEAAAPTAVEAAGGWAGLIPAAVIYFGVIGFGAWYFTREAPRIAEAL
jgi:ABC-2 type transport system permease protein